MNRERRKATTFLAIALAVLAATASCMAFFTQGASSNSASSDWSMWRADATHSSTAQTGPSSLQLAWNYTTSGAVISSPSVVNGTLYVGSQDKNIYALDAWNGNLIWKYATLDAVLSSPAVADGKVYTGGDDGYVYCLDAYNGAFQWKTFVNGDLPYTYAAFALKSSPAVADGIVYVGSIDGNLYAINGADGHVEWAYPAKGPILSSPAISNGAVFFTSEEPQSGALYKLDAQTGALLWKRDLPYEYQFTGGTEMKGSPSVANGMVFAPADLRSYYAFDEASGEALWTFRDPDAMEFIVCSPIYVNGEVFIIDKFSLTSLNAATGDTNWSFFTGDELYSPPSYADGKIYMMTSQRHIYILAANSNCSKLAMYTTSSGSWSSPTIANGRLYIGNHDWNVYCFADAQNGATPTPPNNPEWPTYTIIAIALAVALVAIALVFFALRLRRKKAAV